MKWAELGRKIAGLGAPIAGAALGPAGAVVGGLIARKLGLPDNATPDTVAGVIDANPESAKANLQALDAEQSVELERLKLAAETHAIRAETERAGMVNETMRVETQSESRYVRGWRPTIGYVAAFLIGWVGAGVGFVLVYAALYPSPERLDMLAAIARLLADLQIHFAAIAAVLGVSVAKRSADKAAAAGAPKPKGFIGGVLSAMNK